MERRRRIVAGLAMLAAAVAGTGVAVARLPTGPAGLTTIDAGLSPLGIAVDSATRRVFVLNGHGNAVALFDADTLVPVRTVPLGHPFSNIAVDERAGRVIVTTADDDTASVLDARTGAVAATVTVAYGTSQVAVDARRGHAFLTAGVVYMLDTRSGRARALPFDLSGVVVARTPPAIDSRLGRMVVVNGEIYTGGGPPSTTVDVFDTGSGALLRVIQPGYTVLAVAVDERSSHSLVALSNDGILTLDTRSGRTVYATLLGTPVSTLIDDDRTGYVFALSYGHGVEVLNAATGRLVRSITPGTIIESAILDPRRSRLVLVGNGIVVVDTHSAAMRRLHAAGEQYLDGATMALDERTGRIFIAQPSIQVPAPDPWAWLPAALRQALPFIPRPSDRLRTVPGSVVVVDPSR